ncbi:MAG: hypothetical protein O7A98_04585 [Acidobacteria bacterium]|nr:hypothetical protein [Acidobacteriota bacterium]
MIVSRQNRLIKDIRRLRRSKGDRALLEGPHTVAAALAAGLDLEIVLATPEVAADPSVAVLLEPLGGLLQLVDADVLDSVADVDTPRGLVAVAVLPRRGVEALPRAPGGLYVYADGLQEPGNLGALARVAEAAGVAGLALAPGSAHPNHPRALRGSAGSLLRLPVAREVEPSALERRLEGLSPTWLALVPRDGSDLYATTLPESTLVLLLGGEGSGLSSAALLHSDLRVTLPMRAPVESLNVTVAAALVLYEIVRRRDRAAG